MEIGYVGVQKEFLHSLLGREKLFPLNRKIYTEGYAYAAKPFWAIFFKYSFCI